MMRFCTYTATAAIGIAMISSVPALADPANPIPSPPNGYQAPFENGLGIGASYANGQTFENCFNGWTNADPDDAVVTNLFDVLDAASSNSYFAANPKPINYNHTNFSQVLCIDGGISNSFNSIKDLCYWIDMVVSPVRWTEESDPQLASDSHAGLYVDSNGVIRAYITSHVASGTNEWISLTGTEIGSNDWIRLTLKMDYFNSGQIQGYNYVQIYVNGAAISNAAGYSIPDDIQTIGTGFAPDGGTYFAMANISASNIAQVAFRNTAKLDDFVITTNTIFSGVTHTITAKAEGTGTISPSGNVTVGDGFNQLFTFSGGTIQNIVVDGVTNAPASFYLFENVTTDHTICALFSGGGATSNSVPHFWLAQFGLPQNDAGGDSNTDLDGSDATTEYYFGTNPTNENSDATITKNWILADGSQVICWLGGTNGSANPFQIWCSTNLSDAAAWTNVSNQAHANNGTNYWTNAAPDSRAFYEIRVAVP